MSRTLDRKQACNRLRPPPPAAMAASPDDITHANDIGGLPRTAVKHHGRSRLHPDVLPKLVEPAVVATEPFPSGHHCVRSGGYRAKP